VTSSKLNSGALSEVRLIREKGRLQMLDGKVENRGINVKWRIITLLPFSAAEVCTEGSVCLRGRRIVFVLSRLTRF
jgi:hypothetical protein